MNSATVRTLSARSADRPAWVAVRDLCCRTGDNGDPIARDRWELFSRVWIEPYEKLVPEWTYVADSSGIVVGYLTGCPDSRTFTRRKRWRVVFPLLLAIGAGQYRHVPGATNVAKEAVGIRRRVESCFSPSLQREILIAFPAHLHMNIDARYRRMGFGHRLVNRYFEDLRRCAVPGVHLYCGEGPVPFYRSLGFDVLESVEIRGHSTFAMGIHL